MIRGGGRLYGGKFSGRGVYSAAGDAAESERRKDSGVGGVCAVGQVWTEEKFGWRGEQRNLDDLLSHKKLTRGPCISVLKRPGKNQRRH